MVYTIRETEIFMPDQTRRNDDGAPVTDDELGRQSLEGSGFEEELPDDTVNPIEMEREELTHA